MTIDAISYAQNLFNPCDDGFDVATEAFDSGQQNILDKINSKEKLQDVFGIKLNENELQKLEQFTKEARILYENLPHKELELPLEGFRITVRNMM